MCLLATDWKLDEICKLMLCNCATWTFLLLLQQCGRSFFESFVEMVTRCIKCLLETESASLNYSTEPLRLTVYNKDKRSIL